MQTVHSNFDAAYQYAKEHGTGYVFDGKTLIFVAENIDEEQMFASELRPIVEGISGLAKRTS